MANDSQLLLIDLSGIAHMVWHISGNEPDPSFVSREVIARVRALASNHPHAAICCDDGKSFRADIDPTYKANRDTDNRAPLRHQMDVACETLAKDGFPIWRVKGFEADDLIASAVAQATAIDDTSVLIASSDKDLLQLVNERVSAKSLVKGDVLGPEEVAAKFGVTPAIMLDYLCLVGDVSDNIKGAKGIGGVNAAKLLKEHGSIAAIYEKMAHGVVPGLTPGLRSSLVEFADRWPTVRKLIELRQDAPIPFHEIAVEREAAPMVEDAEMGNLDRFDAALDAALESAGASTANKPAPQAVPFQQGKDANDAPLPFSAPEPTKVAPTPDPRPAQRIEPKATDIAVQQPPAPVDFSQQLEPRNIDEAKMLAKYAFASRMFSAYGTEQAVLMVLMAGRELGMSAMASLRGFHLVEGKATLSADLIRALIIRSGKAKYFRPTERTATRATWETQRGDDPPISLSFTIEEAQQAGVVKNGSGWTKYPADMLTARASAKLARLVYSDIVFNLYDPSEIG